jgi:hypothetical protein
MTKHRTNPLGRFKQSLNKAHAMHQLSIPLSPKLTGNTMLETALPLLLSDTKLRRGRLKCNFAGFTRVMTVDLTSKI